MRITTSLALLSSFLGFSLFAAPAFAARDRVFVASYGSDSNPCTFGSPCKTFQAAVNAVAPGGEVTAIDSAGFGPVIISHAVTITSPNGVEAGITSGGGSGITINAASTDVVALHGLTLIGANTALNGIEFNSGASLDLVGCTVRDFISTGILYSQPTTAATLTVLDSYMSNIGGQAIYLSVGSNNINARIDHLTVTQSDEAIYAASAGSPQLLLTVTNSNFSHVTTGMDLGGNSQGTTIAYLLNVVFTDAQVGAMFMRSDVGVFFSHTLMYPSIGIQTETGASNINYYTDETNLLTGGGSGTFNHNPAN